MEIRRFFAAESDLCDDVFNIEGEEAEHALRVLRHKKGYKVIVCTGDGFDYNCEIIEIGKDFFRAKIEKKVFNDTEAQTEVVLFAALSKNDKFEVVVQKATELGLCSVVPVYTKYSEKYVPNMQRLNKIALEASKQCKRSHLLRVEQPICFNDALKKAKFFDKCIMAYEKESVLTISDIDFSTAKSIALIIGAEGGFDDEEAKLAAFEGVKTVSLGKRVLRTETAAVALCTITMFCAGEMKL